MTEPSPYAPPAAVVRDQEALPLANDPQAQRSLYAAFAQDDRYVAKWRNRLEGTSNWAGFNWPAAIFGLVWCFYRKLYGLGIAALLAAFLVPALAGVFIGLFAPQWLTSNQILNLVAFVSTVLFVQIPLGFIANRVYFRRASKAIAECIEGRLSGAQALAQLHRRGGTSMGGLIVGVVISAAVRLLLRDL